MKVDTRTIAAFRREVWKYYKQHGRHSLPWRKTRDAYKILVSEVMLQQTQVSRVLEKYREFLKAFPSVKVLARAKLSDVLKIWSGLGYNRRGKYLHDAAKAIVTAHNGNLKKALEQPLSGVGPYTRAAVRVFAYNEPHTMIETNIRAVYIHHFARLLCKPGLHRQDMKFSDTQLLPLIEKGAEGQDPREWHWALMDYGVHIKQLHKNPARRSAQYVRQSSFKGSLRQIRGAILRALHQGPQSESVLLKMARLNLAMGDTLIYQSKFKEALDGLMQDGLVVKAKGKWKIA